MPSAALCKHTVEAHLLTGTRPSWWPGVWPWYSVCHRCEGKDMMSIFVFEVLPWLQYSWQVIASYIWRIYVVMGGYIWVIWGVRLYLGYVMGDRG